MSLINKISNRLRLGDLKRKKSNEEKEVKIIFPEMDELNIISIVNEYSLWKNIIESDNELTFVDYIKDITGEIVLKRKQIITKELKEKVLQSIQRGVIYPNSQ